MNQLNETDFGTPARVSEQRVTLEIDGVSVEVVAGTSVMRAAVEAGINVPKLCATDSLGTVWLLSLVSGGNRKVPTAAA